MERVLAVFLSSTVFALSSIPALAADADHGHQIARKFCAPCHVMGGMTNKAGPHLQHIIGRRAASVEGYRYSNALREAGANGLVWDAATLGEFLASPKSKVPGNSMRFAGFWFQSEIDDLIAYLDTLP